VKVMFLDESGNHALDVLDPDYPLFVLGGIIVDRTYARTVLERRILTLKYEFFGDPDIVLHTADIVRAKNGFEALKDVVFRDRFYEALNTLMRDLEYTVVACVIKKDEHLRKYGARAADPYMYALEVLVERFCRSIHEDDEAGGGVDGGIMFAEKRRPDLDHQLNLAWEKLKKRGAWYMNSTAIKERIVDLSLKDKSLNIAGLQLADLVVSPIGRAMMGKPTREDWAIVESKFRRVGSRHLGPGLVVLP
jgi:hypothetical protein